MPNWCENNLRIDADEDTKQKILTECISLDEYGNNRLDFEKIVPVGDVEDWYDKHIEKWGTKWNSCDCIIDETVSTGPLEIDMMTAWSPPVPIVVALVEKYHCAARLEYYECGMAFRGEYICRWVIDHVVADVEKDWNMTESDFRELGLLKSA
ncbi:MAG: hypothetical protein LBT24_05285 [Tannerella sp.]|jgi:hypothetical protein|nr:hypothetical protein [Tannerella sp.]